jgi:tRNA ligase
VNPFGAVTFVLIYLLHFFTFLKFQAGLIMAGQHTAPYVSQNVQETARLIRNLGDSTKKDGHAKKNYSCKKSTFAVASSELCVDSWRFQDWDYKRDDLPTYARGLFTTKDQNGQPEIAIRGYDKFFNTGEVPATKWENIEKDTKGPYELSLKENGCIIFISGLTDGSLLVCSKHSTGERSDLAVSHASAGERWVDRQLKPLGKTRRDLAKELRKRNATAVAELCDDEFEEHILAYDKDSAGMYLHGININIPEFMTYPGNQVQAFADEWGFKRTDFLMIEDISDVRTFLESVAETGSYNGRDVEGFVIRCKSRLASGPNQDWFFKYKFEEPYLMYRQWRECTKSMISGKAPRIHKHVKITEEYLLYARKRLAREPGLAKSYNQNHGIIALRDDFLKEINMKGSDIVRQEYATTGGAPEDVSKDVILVPIATIGCGKTTIALALTHLFNWGHVQNDNITGKGRPPRFTKEVLDQLKEAPVVYADRNNAQKMERRQLITDVHRQHPFARLIALNFVHSKQTLDKIREITHERVFSRGDNHQTIRANADPNKVVGIMEGFIHRFEALQPFTAPDDGFDAVIDLDPTLESRQNLETVIGQLHALYPRLFTDMPTSEDLDEAISFALNEYKPEIKHDVSGGPKNKAKEVRP